MGVLAILTYLNGTQVTQFLSDSDLSNYTAVGDVQIKIIYANIPDYVINTLLLTTASKDLNMKLTPDQVISLFLQGGIISANDPVAIAQASQGNYTLQDFINQFLNENQQPPNVGGTIAPSYSIDLTKAVFSTDMKSVNVAITAKPVGNIPQGATELQFNVQITDKKTGKITNDDEFRTAIDGNPAYATFSENIPLGTNDVLINIYLIEPYISVQLADPIIGYELGGNHSVIPLITNNLLRDIIISASLAVGVPFAIVLAFKYHKKHKKREESK